MPETVLVVGGGPAGLGAGRHGGPRRGRAAPGGAGGSRAAGPGAAGATTEVKAGAVVVATGFQHFDPGRETQMYGYYEYDDVITLAAPRAVLKQQKFGKPPH